MRSPVARTVSVLSALALFAGAVVPDPGQAPARGRVLEGLRMRSAALGRDVAYAVYLPPDYESSTRRYPVVYLLHGYTDNESGWVQYGEVGPILDRAIADGKVPPLIVVMPDGGVSWYVNDHRGKVRYEDMFVRELIPHVDAKLRTRPQREFRGIAGLSMGGFGTLVQAFRHPDLFASCAAFSAAVWTDEEIAARRQEDHDRYFAPVFGPGLAGRDRLTAHFREHNPLDLARTLPEASLKKVRCYIDCGDDDFLIRGNCALHLVLADRRIPHEFRVRDGGHTWAYWRSGLADGLAFIGEAFRR